MSPIVRSDVEPATDEPAFNFYLERMKKAVEGPAITIPRGMRGEELRAYLSNRLREIDEAEAQSKA
ncbi:MAG: hypothetical protein RSD49_06750 [Hafnia sp.]